MLCAPSVSAEAVNDAAPTTSGTIASTVAPSLNVTVPVGVVPAAPVTVAVKVTGWCALLGLGEDESAVVVDAGRLITWTSTGEVLPVKLALPL
jgi:hypothetical protein